MKNKVLVYDSSGGYKRFIKLYFNEEFDCKSYFDYKAEDDINYDEFAVLFFFVDNPLQLVDLLRIYKKVNLTFLGTRILKINDSIRAMDDSVFLDLTQSRPEILDCIRFNLKLFGLTKE